MKRQITRHEWEGKDKNSLAKTCIHCECVRIPVGLLAGIYHYWPLGSIRFFTKSPKCITRKKPEDGTKKAE